MAASLSSTISADQHKMSQLQSQAQQTTETIQAQRTKMITIKSMLAHDESSLKAIDAGLSENLRAMRQTERHIETLKHSVREKQIEIDRCKAQLRHQMQTMYENGTDKYIAVILASTSWNDFLSRLYLLITIAKADQGLEHRMITLRNRLGRDERMQRSLYSTLAQRHDSFVLLKQANLVIQAQRQRNLAQLSASIQSETVAHGELESQIQLTQGQIHQLEVQTAQAEALMQNHTYVQQTESSMTSINLTHLLSYAETFMGIPYVWGGESPSGFDCSGFTQYVFGHFGISINRTAAEQFAQGVSVSTSQLAPGDLVFFSTYAPGATHVGIYMGNGLMIDAQDYGVSIDHVFNSYWGPRYIGAREIVKN